MNFIIIRLAVWHYAVSHAILNCPVSIDDWNEASVALQCEEPNFYHCLQNEKGNFEQQCLQRVWIQDGMCPEYNSRAKRIDVYDCNSQLDDCPTATFWSNAVYIYPGCFTTTTSPPSQTTMISTSDNAHTEIVSSGEKESNNTTNTIVIAVCSATLIIIVICVVIFWRMRRRRNREPKPPTDVEVRTDTEEERVLIEPKPPTDVEVRTDTEEERVLIEMEGTNSNSEDKDTKIKQIIKRKDKTDGLLEIHGNNHKMKNEDNLNKADGQVQDIGKNELQPDTDADNLEKNGVIIFISDDTSKIDLRMKSLDDTGRFGLSSYVGSLSYWDHEEDISLYLFKHSLDNINSAHDLMDLTEKLQEMHKRATMVPKSYFVLSFQTDEWSRFEKDLLEYYFFKKAVRMPI